MGFLATRISTVSLLVSERSRHGLPEQTGDAEREALFILDGVGGFQIAPLAIRKALRALGSDLGTVVYCWQYGLMGEIWTDLCWLRRNRVMGAKLARKLLAFRRSHPKTAIHMIAVSGGAGIAVFALETLRGRRLIDTLILASPALSPGYNLGPALRCVERGYAWISRKDTGILGLGTTIFGTTDRRHCGAAGQVGFRLPPDVKEPDRQAYRRFRELHWTEELTSLGHRGGHSGYVAVPFLKRHLLPTLQGEPLLDTQAVADPHARAPNEPPAPSAN